MQYEVKSHSQSDAQRNAQGDMQKDLLRVKIMQSQPRMRRWLRAALSAATAALILVSAPVFAINEAQFIDKVLAQDHLLEEAQIGLQIKRLELDASRDNYANWKAELSAEVGYREVDYDRDTTSTSNYNHKTVGKPIDVDLAIEKRFLSNPGSLKVGVDYGEDRNYHIRYIQKPKGSSPKYHSEYGLTNSATRKYVKYSFPLLKHDGNAVSLKSYRRNILDLKRQKLSFFETKEDFLSERLEDYLSWLLYHRYGEVDRATIKQLTSLSPQDDSEADLLQSAMLNIQGEQTDNENKLRSARQRLAVLLNDASLETDSPQFDLMQRADMVEKNLTKYLRTNNRDLKSIAHNIELSELEIAYYQNRELPTLDWDIEVERTDQHGESSSTIYDEDRWDYSTTLEFRIPLGGNVLTKSYLTRYELGVRKLEISYAEKLQDLIADIQSLHALLAIDDESLRNAVAAAARSANNARQQHREGAVSLRDYLQALLDEREARHERIERLVAYQKNRLEYDNLLDRMIGE